MKILDLMKDYDSLIMSFLTLILVITTIGYAKTTKNMAKSSAKLIEQEKNFKEIEYKKNEQAKINYMTLLSSEMFMNYEMYVLVLAHLENHVTYSFIKKVALKIKSSTVINDESIKEFAKHYTYLDYWNSVYSECSKHFKPEIIVELVGYYTGVKQTKIISSKNMSNSDFGDFIKEQLIITQKCFEFFRNEGAIFRSVEIIEVEGLKFKFDVESKCLEKL